MAPQPHRVNRDPNSMRSPPRPSPPSSLTPPAKLPRHQSDADEDDENVKQLQECSSVYLSLQKFKLSRLAMTGETMTDPSDSSSKDFLLT